MTPYFYSDTISNFLTTSTNEIFGSLSHNSDFPDDPTQKGAWTQEIRILKNILENHEGRILFEYSLPRMGRRIDVVLITRNGILF